MEFGKKNGLEDIQTAFTAETLKKAELQKGKEIGRRRKRKTRDIFVYWISINESLLP